MSSGRVMDGDPSSALPTRPSWFKPQRAAPKPVKAAPPLVAVDPTIATVPHPPTTWTGRFTAVVTRAGFGWGWLTSGIVHLVLLASLGMLAYQTRVTPQTELTGVFGVPGNDTVLDIDSSMDAGGSLAPLDFEAVGVTSIVDPTGSGSAPLQVLGAVDGQLGGDGLGDGGNGSGGLGSLSGNVRVPASAVTRGSFTVWTEPEDPLPGRAYEIVIQVKVSPEIKGYRLRDLSGRVTGTDKYEKVIRFKATDRKPVKEGAVQVRIDIPGADRLVKDTIFIRSEILKEEQTIEIVF